MCLSQAGVSPESFLDSSLEPFLDNSFTDKSLSQVGFWGAELETNGWKYLPRELTTSSQPSRDRVKGVDLVKNPGSRSVHHHRDFGIDQVS